MNRFEGWMVCGLALALVGALGCDGEEEGGDAGPMTDAPPGEDAGPPSGDIALPGLDGEVEVIIDDRGVPHIYASTVHDLQMAQGYLMARDRFAQMEFIRRNVLGRLAEVAGSLDASLVGTDRNQRFLGFGRVGRAIYESLPADDPTRLVAEAFVAGINAYIDQVVLPDDGVYQPPRGSEVVNIIVTNENFGHWHPADVFALARFQSFSLSYDAGADINRTRALAGVRESFPTDDDDPRLHARRGLFGDLWSDRPARPVYTRDGFPNVDEDSGSRAFLPNLPGIAHDGPGLGIRLPPIPTLDRAAAFFDAIEASQPYRRDEHFGSNSWMISGAHTASGRPILANDPHLSLISPPVWWYVHLNTERMGGELDIDAEGVAFAGLPGVVLGYNRDVAWSATTTGYDVTDVYQEEVTFENRGSAEEPEWVPVSVRFDGADVALEIIEEEILITGGSPETFILYDVPHHGPLIPDTIEPPTEAGETVGSALSVRYTGHVPTNELAYFVNLLTASNADEAREAQDPFEVGAQNFSIVTRDGDIAWSTKARIPQRQAAACSFEVNEDGTIEGVSPLFVLPGTGGFEWEEDLDPRYIPHDRNPARGYIANANQDNVGVTADGNPCNDDFYLGGDFAVGYRMGRIVERLDALIERGDLTVEDMIALQAESQSQLGRSLRSAFVAALDQALGDPSDDEVLDAFVAGLSADELAGLQDARDRLAAWTFETPHGVGATDADIIADSVATSIFNVALTRLTTLALGDEVARIGRSPGTLRTAAFLERALIEPESLYTYDEASMQSVIWDDLDTEDVVETRAERITRAVRDALRWLASTLEGEPDSWRWGRMHAVRFGQVVPSLSGAQEVSIPPAPSAEFPLGFPRHGDLGAVDPGNYGIFAGALADGERPNRFTFGSGASQRLVLEMTEEGPVAFNAIPGGQSEDPDSPFHADEAEHWRVNEHPPMRFTREDVEANQTATFRFIP